MTTGTSPSEYALGRGLKARKSSICCIVASIMIFGTMVFFDSSNFSRPPVPNPLGNLTLGIFGALYFGLGIALNKTSDRRISILSIVSSAILLTATPLSIWLAPSTLALSIVLTPPAAILGLLGGILGLWEARVL